MIEAVVCCNDCARVGAGAKNAREARAVVRTFGWVYQIGPRSGSRRGVDLCPACQELRKARCTLQAAP